MAERASTKPPATPDLPVVRERGVVVAEPTLEIALDLGEFALPTLEEIAANGGSINPGEFRKNIPQLKSDEPRQDDTDQTEDWGDRYGEDGLYGEGGKRGAYDVEEVINVFGGQVVDDDRTPDENT